MPSLSAIRTNSAKDFRTHLSHDVVAMKLHCNLADVEIVRNLLVHAPADDKRHDLLFARRQRAKALMQFRHGRGVAAPGTVALDPLRPGNRTSSTRQPGASGRLFCKNSWADPNDCTSRLMERNRPARASRTDESSSITKTTGCSSSMRHPPRRSPTTVHDGRRSALRCVGSGFCHGALGLAARLAISS
jgi:hypothetical protein